MRDAVRWAADRLALVPPGEVFFLIMLCVIVDLMLVFAGGL